MPEFAGDVCHLACDHGRSLSGWLVHSTPLPCWATVSWSWRCHTVMHAMQGSRDWAGLRATGGRWTLACWSARRAWLAMVSALMNQTRHSAVTWCVPCRALATGLDCVQQAADGRSVELLCKETLAGHVSVHNENQTHNKIQTCHSAVTWYVPCRALATALDCVRQAADGRSVELLRKESLACHVSPQVK